MKKNKRKIYVIGFNTFSFDDLPLNIKELFKRIENIAIPESFFDETKKLLSERLAKDKNFFPSRSDNTLIEWLKFIDNDVILISRGDPLWYGIGRILLKHFSQEELLFYPSKTCVQLAFSRLKRPWQGTKTVSIHGRDSKALINSLIKKEKSIAILTDPKNNTLDLIRKNLKELNLEKCYEFWLLEELGNEKEKISLISDEKDLPKVISELNLVVLLQKKSKSKISPLPLFGINDNNFQSFDDRPNLQTKRDIRIQILADLELPELGTIVEIGSGTGTIGLEALRIRPKIDLICIDKRFGSEILVKENAIKLGVSPLKIIEGDVKQFLSNDIFKKYLSSSNRIVIGGCDVETKILAIRKLTKYLQRGDIIVIPIIIYEVLKEITFTLNELNYETNMRLIQTYKGISIGEGTRFEPNNPVFIVKAKKK